MTTRKHLAAVEAAIAAGAHELTDADEPLLELARTLARQMDAGPAGRVRGWQAPT